MKNDSAASQISDAGTTTEIDTCADAVNKIESAITLSCNFMEASGDKPTIDGIQAVLVTLQTSLDSECTDAYDRLNERKTKRDGVLDDILGGDAGDHDDDDDEAESAQNSYVEFCGCEDLEESVAIVCLQACASSKDVLDSDGDSDGDSNSKTLVAREIRCSECERQLYQIVQRLQEIFTIAGEVEPAVPSAPAVPDTDVPGGILEPAVNATTLALFS